VVSASNLEYKVRSLRTRLLRDSLHRRQAALFAVGMSVRFPDYTFKFAQIESSDYDAVVRRSNAEECQYSLVQLKELVPEHLNADVTIDDVLNGLKKYEGSADLIVAVFLNRRFKLDLNALQPRTFKLGGLFLFFSTSNDQRQWHMFGDLLSTPTLTTFSYPA
jgi:hypothetical protein